jgi:hypothetical protein
VRNDNITNFSYVAKKGTGGTIPPERYHAYRPGQPEDPTPIQPGGTALLKNEQTSK